MKWLSSKNVPLSLSLSMPTGGDMYVIQTLNWRSTANDAPLHHREIFKAEKTSA
uniref:Uncharacterized protein n=1 Tax=Rhizophora mucronata TaxID=61149 RepID=A0A2P2NYR1_RHIMU